MDTSKWYALIGNFLYALGVFLMVYSYRVNTKVMGLAALGVAVISPDEESAEWKKKEKLRKTSDQFFYGGMVLTLVGVIAQTVGVLK
jgi:hypothetical protein